MSTLYRVFEVISYTAYLYAPPFIAVALAFLAGKLAWSLIPTPAPVRAIERVTGEAEEDRPALTKAPGLGPLARLFPVSEQLRANLRLLQAMGRFQSLNAEDLVVMRLVGVVFGLLFLLTGNIASMLAGLGIAVVGYMSPDMWLAGQADAIRRDLFRELPDAAENLAFLVGMGQPVDAALRRLAEGDTVFSRLLRAGIAATPPGQSPVMHLATWVEPFRVPALTQLFRRLAEIARRGVGDRALLGDLAASVAAQYEADLMKRAEGLENKFTPIMGVFFLLPYIALMVAPFIVTMVRAFMQ